VPDANVLLPLVIFFGMGAAILWLLWRVVVLGGRARRETASGAATAEIAHRSETLLGDLLVVVDEVRRRKVAPQDAEPQMAEAQAALQRNVAEATALTRSGAWASSAVALVADLERAQRAIEFVSHGAQLLADVTGVDWGEGETSVKRGYLNLVHAREAIRERRETIVQTAQQERKGWHG
jgi:hypothetical protein